MLKKMLTAGALALFLASSAYAADAAKDAGKKDKPAAAKKHGGKAHKKGHCTKDGKELTTTDITTKTQPSVKPGHVIRRQKTCEAEGRTWEMAAANGADHADAAKPADAKPAKGEKKAKGSKGKKGAKTDKTAAAK